MRLFYKPGACSLSPHVVLREANLPFTLVRVDTKEGRTETGEDFRALNAKGYVPALQLDSGEVLTEGQVIVQYLADHAPASRLIPPAGTLERYRVQEWLAYIATELHKGYSPLWNKGLAPEARQAALRAVEAKLDFVARRIGDGAYLTGPTFGVADAYLFTVLSWSKAVGVDLSRWPTLGAYVARVSARPAVQAALKAEGLT